MRGDLWAVPGGVTMSSLGLISFSREGAVRGHGVGTVFHTPKTSKVTARGIDARPVGKLSIGPAEKDGGDTVVPRHYTRSFH